MKKILLTGATGYLGRNLAKRFLKDGCEVVALVREGANLTYLEQLGDNIKLFQFGKQKLETVFELYEIDIVIHTAASYGRKGEDIVEIVNANLYYPIQMLDLAIKNGVKYFVNTDTALPKALNFYAHSKKQFLEWLEMCATQINVLNLQLEYFYGPNDDPSKFITYVLRELKSGKEQIPFTDATPFRDFIYIDDVVNAYSMLIAHIENIKGIQTVEIGSGNAVMLKYIIQEIQAISNNYHVHLNFGALPMRANEIMHSCADISYLKNIGWEPKYTFKEGILETIKIENNVL